MGDQISVFRIGRDTKGVLLLPEVKVGCMGHKFWVSASVGITMSQVTWGY